MADDNDRSDLGGRVIAVVGASAGIGKATAEAFLDRGATVVLLARGKERLDAMAAELGERAVPVAMDMADPESVRAAFAAITAQFGKLDALLNVAGVARATLIEDASDEDIAYVTGINFLGPIYTTRAAIPLLRAAGGGDIVNVSSEVTLDHLPFMTLYSSTKAGLEGFCRDMNRELKSEKIRVSAFVVGRTRTDFSPTNIGGDTASMREVWDASGYNTRISGLEPMEPADVAETLVFLVTRPTGMMLDVMHVRSFS
jgi:NAD(P)-dependent dehydrogenase (short-subunit alcohol dehydrogenase family)